MPFSPVEKQRLMRAMTTPVPMECIRIVSTTNLVAILNAVRNTILKWSLSLEQQGILGEGMRFSNEEKAIAMTNQNIHIANFQGVLGDISGSAIAQNLEMAVNAGDFKSLKQKLAEAGIEESDLAALQEALATDPRPSDTKKLGPQVSTWIGTMMSKAASGTWKITLDTASKLLPLAIAAYYGLKG